jgi:phosphatidylinositol alpha-1,6-mannosyltransferase
MLTHEFPPEPAGVGTSVASLAAAASALGHVVTVWAPDYDDTQPPPAGRFTVQRYHGGRFRARNLGATLRRARRATRDRSFDLVHAMDWPHVASLGFWNRFGVRAFQATAYGTEIVALRTSRLSRLLRAERAFHAATRICAISAFTRDLLLRACPDVDADRIVVTPLGVEPFWFDAAGDAAPVRARLGIPPDRRVLLTVARLDPRKGHRIVLAALAGLDRALQESIVWVVAGKETDAAHARALRAQAATAGVPVVFTGGISAADLRALYADAAVFCLPGEPHPNKVEGFGLVFLEAAAQGTPALASRVDAIPEVVLDGRTGVLVPPRDAPAYAAALAALLADPARLHALGQAARLRARKFTWQRCAELTYGAP